MPITIPADTHIPGDPGHTTDHNNIADVLTAVCPPYQFWVSKYGALGNGFTLENCANITSGLNVLTRTDGGAFTAGDVGKNIVVNYAGATATTPLSTTISGFTNSTTVTLTANAGRTVTGGDAMYGTDDTAAIQAAINAAVAYAGALAGNCYGEVVFNQGIYVLGSPTVKVASPVFSNSQVNFSSVVAVAAQKLTIKLRGANPSPFAHWNQAVPQVPAGTVLFSTLLGQTFDATFGDPSVIGGPNPTQGYGSGALLFNNMMPVVENITVMCPFNPSVIAYDFRGMAEAWLPNASSSAFATPAEMNTTAPSNSGGVGLYMPSWGNNDRCDVGSFGCEGFYYGVAFGEHFNAQRLGLIYTNTAIFVNTDSATRHGAFIGYASVEVCTHVIQANPSATTAAQFPLVIARLDTEFFATDIINDTNSILYGHVSWGGKSGDAVAVTGAKNIELINDQQARGTVTPPSVPATTVAITNPFWRHAAVTIKGGTGAVSAVAIDGTSQGITLASTVTTTVIVPSGKTIALTYAATGPTWTWILL